MSQSFDVLIAGGGPAGSTVATLLAKRGHSVALIEKDLHPRFHIGESLLPMNLPIFEALGVAKEIEHLGVIKRGADFCVGPELDFVTFRFSRALRDSPPNAYEVRRDQFDHALLENARRNGVVVREATAVTAVEQSTAGEFLVEAKERSGGAAEFTCRYFVDATGRDGLLARKRGWRSRNRDHASAAIYAHYRGVTRRPGKDAGNISIYWFDHGWIWMIPLPNDVMSVGAVCQPDYLRTRKSTPTEFLERTLQTCPEAWARMQEATLDRDGQATGNYSYTSSRIGGDGYILIGDSYAFVDPVFSSGVYLAMSSASRAVSVIELWLAGRKASYRLALILHRFRIQRAIRTFSWFIYRFTSPVMRNLFRQPRNVLGTEQAVISMLAGDVYRGGLIRARLAVFKSIYAIASLLQPRIAWKHRRLRRDMAKSDPAV